MNTYRIDTLPCSLPAARRVVALGLFDGVHLGHRAVITAAADLLCPARVGAAPMLLSVFTLRGLNKAPRLCNDEALHALLADTGADELLETDFEAVRELTPETFVTRFLRDTLGAAAVVCGFNFRFGKNAAGDAALLCRLCEAAGIQVRVIEPVTDETGEAVSSSRIRGRLAAGDVAAASRLLGYPFTLRFPVVHGQRLGHALGFPTINQPLPAEHIRLRFGVYASAVIVNGHVTWGVTNVGTHPTVGESVPTAETWIPAFSGDLYGQKVPVTPVKFLREEQSFPSVEALTAQVKRDAAAARAAILGDPPAKTAPAYYNGHPIDAVFFDFDDTLQDRHKAFLCYARQFTAQYLPQLTEEEREQHAQWLFRENGGGYAPAGAPLNYPAFFERVAAHFAPWQLPEGAALWRDYPRWFPRCTALFPDTLSALRLLRERGLIIGLVSNGSAVIQLGKLDHSGLRPLLDVTVVSGSHGIHKPDPELFLRAAAYAGTAPDRCVFVGDHPKNDIAGSAAAGMHPVYLDAFGGSDTTVAAPRISCLSELLPLLGLH